MMDYTILRHQITQTVSRIIYLCHFFFEKSFNKDKIWLYHFRLGHPSFGTLRNIFPSLFKGLNVEDFHCDVSELTKHRRVSFSISNKRSFTPFYLIHSDIWGSSTILNISSVR